MGYDSKKNCPSGLELTDTLEDAIKRADSLSAPDGSSYSGMMLDRKDLRRIVLLVREYRKLLPDVAYEAQRGINILKTLSHDEGAFGCCSYCGRYSDNSRILSHDFQCECGKQHGWSGSFKKPTKESIWSEAGYIK